MESGDKPRKYQAVEVQTVDDEGLAGIWVGKEDLSGDSRIMVTVGVWA